MQMIPVKSQKLLAIGYAPSRRILCATFNPSGVMYDYFDVSGDLFNALVAETKREGGSVGKLFIADVQGPRNAPKFQYLKVVDANAAAGTPERYAPGATIPFATGGTVGEPAQAGLFGEATDPQRGAASGQSAPSALPPSAETADAAETRSAIAVAERPTPAPAADTAEGATRTDLTAPTPGTTSLGAETEPRVLMMQRLSIVATLLPSIDVLEAEAVALEALKVDIVVITSEEQRQPVFDDLTRYKGKQKDLQARVDAVKEPLNAMRNVVLAIEKRICGRLELLAGAADRALTTHRKAVEAEARRVAQAEQERIAKAQREESERIAKAQREQRERDAEALRQAGAHEVAAAVEAQPLPPVILPPPRAPMPAQSSAPRASGERRTVNWKWAFVNPEHPEGLIPISDPANHRYYSLDPTKINADVRSQKNLFSHPGITTWPDEKTGTSGR